MFILDSRVSPLQYRPNIQLIQKISDLKKKYQIHLFFFFLGRGHTKAWTVPVAILLVSAGWWENYVDRRSHISIIKRLGKIKDSLHKTRYFVYSFISILKMLLYFSFMLLFLNLNGVTISTLFSQFHEAFSAHPINVTQINHVGGAFGHDTVLPDIPGGLYTIFLYITHARV